MGHHWITSARCSSDGEIVRPRAVSTIRSVAHQAPGIDILSQSIHCRQPVLCRQVYEASSLVDEHGASQHSQITHAREGS